MIECSGTQCGFCILGFVNSLCGCALTSTKAKYEEAISSVDGNICRCTGYKSIERAAAKVTEQLVQKDQKQPLSWLVKNNFIPDYFLDVSDKLKKQRVLL